MLTDLQLSSTDFWRQIREPKPNPSSNVNPLSWFQYFNELFTPTDEPSNSTSMEPVITRPEIPNDPVSVDFTLEEIQRACLNAKNGKSCGIDGLPNEVWKASFGVIGPTLTKLFNRIYQRALFPNQWRTGVIVPIHKKGPVNDPRNYRGLSLQPCLNNMFSASLNHRLKSYVESNKIINEEQAGFRPGYSTVDNLFVFNSLIHKYVYSNNSSLFGIFVDFKKAYDLIRRDDLVAKISGTGISSRMVKMLKSIYSEINACIKTGSHTVTETFPTQLGLRQGDVLSCYGFALYLNDLCDYLIDNDVDLLIIGELYITMLLYADDLLILDQTARGLQRKINILSNYCQRFGLKPNTDKTKIVCFRKPTQRMLTFVWRLDGVPIEVVNEYKYLGLYIHYSGTWTVARNDLARRANRAIFTLISSLNKYGALPPSVILKIFDAKIIPILVYGCEIWGLSGTKELELVASNMYRRTLGLHDKASVILCRGELGRRTIFHTVLCRMVRHWIKILSVSHDRAIYKSYQYQYHLSNTNRPCWATELKQILFTFGFGDAWINQSVGSADKFYSEFKWRSEAIEYQNWAACVNTYGNLRTYKMLKSELKCEWYLCMDLPRKVINTLVRLRGGLLRIGVNEGRYDQTPLQLRICKLCNSGQIDDEIHFIFYCRALSTFRINLMQYADFRSYSLTSIFSARDRNLLIDLYQFIGKAIEWRDEILRVI